jgi:hypothetical protein
MNPNRHPIIASFEQGEITPLADGRVDIEAYNKSCNKIQNCLNLVQGPCERRPGSYHVAEVQNSAYASRCVPFRYSADISFVIEIGHQIMRFFSFGARIALGDLVPNGSMEGVTDWYDVGTPTTNEFSTEQYHSGGHSRKVVTTANGDGSKSDVFPISTTSGLSMVGSLFVYPSEETILVQVREADDSGWAYSQEFAVIPDTWNWIHFDFDISASGSNAYIQVVSTSSDPIHTFYFDDVEVRQLVRTVTPWSASEIDQLRYRQVGNVIYFRHPDYPDYKLMRETSTYWPLTLVDNYWPPFLDQNTDATTIQASAVTGAGITVTASAAIFKDGHEGSHWKIVGDKPTSNDFSANGNGTAVEMDAAESFIISLSGTWSGSMYLQRSYDGGSSWVDYAYYTSNISIELTNLEDDTQWRWQMQSYASGTCTARISLRNKAGYFKIVSITSPPATTCTADVVEDLPHTNATDKWSEGAWSDYQGYPRVIAFYENRRVQGSTALQPTRLWGSVVDDYESWEPGVTDDKAWNYSLASAEINQINWMLEGDVLHIGTSGDEWRFGDADAPTTPTSVSAKAQTYYGSYDADAVKAGTWVVFIEDGGRALRSIRYNYDTEKYEANQISTKAEHLFKGADDLYIKQIAYASRPVPTIWIRMSDGTLRSATFDTTVGISAFNRHTIGGSGFVESICVIRGPIYDELWMEVLRTINSQSVRYIEYIQFSDWNDKEDAYFVDSGYTYEISSSTKYITGLNHLEGEEVDIFCDGYVHHSLTVENGAITLDNEISSKASIGYGYTSIITPKAIELKSQGGDTIQGRKVLVPNLKIRLLKTMACKVGTVEGETDYINFRTIETPLGESHDPFTGDKYVQVRGQGVGGNLCVECDLPVPMTVIAIMPTVQITSDN